MKWPRSIFPWMLVLVSQAFSLAWAARGQSVPSLLGSIRSGTLAIAAFDDGFYALQSTAIPGDVLRSGVEADTPGGTLRSSLYPRHLDTIVPFSDELGSGRLLTVTHTGLFGKPDLVCEFRVYEDQPWGDIRVSVSNSTGKPIEVDAIRIVKTGAGAVLQLNGPPSADRILSDSFSEDTPQMKVMDLGEADRGLHRAFGSQLVYNRQSGLSLFLGALSAEKFLTVFHLQSSQSSDPRLLSYDVADTGTTEALEDQKKDYPPGNAVSLRLRVPVGKSLASERLMFSIGSDYHAQLENYGHAVRILHKPNLAMPSPIGWWSWTAYYYRVTENTVLTNAAWLKQNLASLGYRYFFVDEGYQYARGEYATADGKAFPRGMAYVGHQVENQGLTFGLWVAPFQISERSWVYEHHKDWLVRNLAGEPIHLGKVGGNESFDELYALDTTNPGAQEYLRSTYRTLVNNWGVRLIKLDFMDSSTVEGVHYRPDTTALEALRIGLHIIRDTVGDDVLLDKDGSPMLTPVGLVNAGRISQDTGHTFGSTKDAAAGVAARYYMHRNFYISDPDAFTVSKQIVPDRVWHGNKEPLTLEEAEASIALSAVSGGMFEIGDDLPALGASPERLALVKNPDLLDMVRLSRAAVPLDLMTYRAEDTQPSVFLLEEDPRQRILTVFNWTAATRTHTLALDTLGLKANGSCMATDVLRGGAVPIENGALAIMLPPHSVRMVKLIDASVPERSPAFEAHAPSVAQAGALIHFHAAAANGHAPVLGYHWEFGDGVSSDGADVSHAYTQAGPYAVKVVSTGLNGSTTENTLRISVTGIMPTGYNPAEKVRYRGAD
jgi:hypothetical protein